MALERIIDKIAGDYNAKQLKIIEPLVGQINDVYESWHELSDDDIKAKTAEFRQRITDGESVDDIMIEAFATVKQACKRLIGTETEVKGVKETWQMIPYDVQLIGGIVLHKGMNAEMRTGEGKTLVATLPAYLNALSGKGVHIVTVNDYLASRDAEWMGLVYNWLGLTVGSVTKGVPLDQRKELYERDITYVENSELGFDYLRDNLATTIEDRNLLWRPLHYAIVDEVDSILIDEARTPLIISQPSDEPTEKYGYYAKLVPALVPSKAKKRVSKGFLSELMKDVKGAPVEEEDADGGDYYVDEKTKTVTLSSEGIEKLEKLLKVDNLYKDLGYDEIHHIENALRAQAVYNKDKEYLIRDGQVLIVDENTGRAMPGRRYGEGLHQAIEAKEGLEIQRESKTLASITYQHFFKQYEKLSGMTGTAVTEAEEFEKIYDLEVLTIPTNRPIIRVDKNDNVYFNQNAKWKAVVDHITFYNMAGLPILIGTSSIHTSELVSTLLRKASLTHTVLNAKFHEQEANIVMNAGKKGSIVVATNMAGRGTDIKLDKDLYSEIAINYAKAMQKAVQKGHGLSGVVYSAQEYDRMINAMGEVFGVSDENMQQAIGAWIKTGGARIKITLNSNKKGDKEKARAEIVVQPAEKDADELIEKDFHFGLFILGTEKHESRRIDNQLRGRAGRQGDPGVSQFFVAMDDEIMRKMGGNKIQAVARMLMSKEELENIAFTQKQFTNSIATAQKQMEGRHFGIRKHLFDYDSVINKQRTRIYAKRDEILEKDKAAREAPVSTADDNEGIVTLSIVDEVKYFIDDVVENLVDTYVRAGDGNIPELIEAIQSITGASFVESDYAGKGPSTVESLLTEQLHETFDAIIDDVDDDKLQSFARRVYLRVLDRNRMQHITDMQYLREKVGLYGYAQLDPLVIYKKEAYGKFQSLLFAIKKETLGTIMRADFAAAKAAEQIAIEAQKKNASMVDILKAVTSGLKARQQQPSMKQRKQAAAEAKEKVHLKSGEDAVVVEDDGDVEVLEVTDDPTVGAGAVAGTGGTDLSGVKKKIRPNDKVNIQYPDGRIDYGVKWKKVKDIVEKGEAALV